jgi:hypothetical protein
MRLKVLMGPRNKVLYVHYKVSLEFLILLTGCILEGLSPRLHATVSASSAAGQGQGMAEYRCGAHTVYGIHPHLVWATKYRKPVLVGEAATRAGDVVREIWGIEAVKIMRDFRTPRSTTGRNTCGREGTSAVGRGCDKRDHRGGHGLSAR